MPNDDAKLDPDITVTDELDPADVAVITALLRAQGTDEDGKPFDYALWFSDIYTCGAQGWRYTFAQSSIRLPQAP